MTARIVSTFMVAGLCALAAQPAGSRAPATPPAPVSAPVSATVSDAIPTTATSHPLLDGTARLQAIGYVQEEFILSGKANVYGWTGVGHQVRTVAGPADYATRILVWRPRDARKFSGNVEINVLNATAGADNGKPTDFGRMAEQGDVWIGITTKAIAAQALKRFDPVRYAALRWDNPAPVAARCAVPSIIPAYMSGSPAPAGGAAAPAQAFSAAETEDGLVWDMMGQLAQLLKSDGRQKILPGFGKPTIYMTGVSQSSLIVRTFALAFHDRYRTADGRPVYDGYLGVVGPALLRLNECEQDVPLQDPRQKFTALDVPFISLSSEGEMWMGRYTSQPDRVARRGGWVTYEVAGASHTAGEIPSPRVAPSPAPSRAPAAAGGALSGMAAALGSIMPAGAKQNDLPWAPIVRGAYHNLQLWVRQGVVPPRAVPIAIDQRHEIRRDEAGNAIGGIRTPYIDAPTAAHTGYLSAGGIGGITGASRPFSPDALKRLYPEPSAYIAKFSVATDRLLADRWISREDAEAMKKSAADRPMTN